MDFKLVLAVVVDTIKISTTTIAIKIKKKYFFVIFTSTRKKDQKNIILAIKIIINDKHGIKKNLEIG